MNPSSEIHRPQDVLIALRRALADRTVPGEALLQLAARLENDPQYQRIAVDVFYHARTRSPRVLMVHQRLVAALSRIGWVREASLAAKVGLEHFPEDLYLRAQIKQAKRPPEPKEPAEVTEPVMSGLLETFAVPALIEWMVQIRANGVLTIRGENKVAKLWFTDGGICAVIGPGELDATVGAGLEAHAVQVLLGLLQRSWETFELHAEKFEGPLDPAQVVNAQFALMDAHRLLDEQLSQALKE